MPAYEISYDLSTGDRDDYQELYDALGKLRGVRATESSWYVATTWSAGDLATDLRGFMHKKDVLTVDELRPGRGHTSYGLSAEAIAWKKKKNLRVPSVPPILKSRLRG